MPHRKAVRPVHYSEWVEALKQPLTYGNALYMQGGKLKESELSTELTRRIADYVVNTFNAQAEWVRNAPDGDVVFAVSRFNAEFRKLFFFRTLSFIAEKDKRAIAASVTAAAENLAVYLTEKFGDTDPEILFVRNDLRRKIRTENL